MTDVCSICLEDPVDPVAYEGCPAGHGGCRACVLPWVEKRGNCHLCRAEVARVAGWERSEWEPTDGDAIDGEALERLISETEALNAVISLIHRRVEEKVSSVAGMTNEQIVDWFRRDIRQFMVDRPRLWTERQVRSIDEFYPCAILVRVEVERLALSHRAR